jgi:hypothetical protein
LGCTQTPRTSTQAETTTGNGNGSMTTVNWGATNRLFSIKFSQI